MRAFGLAVLGAMVFAPGEAEPHAERAAGVTGRFALSFLGHEVGEERVTEDVRGAGRRITSAFSFEDRGAKVELTASLELDGDGLPIRFTSRGKTYRYFSTAVDVVRVGDRVRVRDGARVETIDLAGRPFFPVDTYAPVSVQEQLIRFWMTHGRPREIVAPPAGMVRISSRGVGLVVPGTDGRMPRTERLAIDGVTWGTETAFVSMPERALTGLMSWTGALPFEAVSGAGAELRAGYMAVAVNDRIADLQALSGRLRPVRQGTYALTGARLIDGTGREPIDNATMLIRAGRIVAVGPAATVNVPPGIPRVNVSGKTIIPGLWDMHADAAQVDWAPVYLASGVTTIRDMGGEREFLVAFRNAVASGRALGPRMLLAGLVDGPGARAFGTVTAATVAEGREVVRRDKRDGFEEIKIYDQVAPDVARAMAAEAHALGMQVTGHTPQGARAAVETGYDQIAHMPLRGAPGSAEAADLIAFFKAHGTAIDATQSWNELLQHAAATPIASFQPGVTRLPPALQRMILSTPGGNGDPAAAAARLLQSLQLLNQAREAGVPVVAGTDKGVPGFSVQREIELYVKGGMTPLQAIQAATIVPARVMRLDADTGTIEAGKRADLVILDADPLASIANIRSDSRVVAAGAMYDTAALWRAAGFKPR